MRKTRKVLSLVVCCSILLTACATPAQSVPDGESYNTHEDQQEKTTDTVGIIEEQDDDKNPKMSDSQQEDAAIDDISVPDFYGMNDENLLQYVKDKVYADLENDFSDDDYKVEGVQAVYVSKDFLEELEYNSRS
ncbi:MAG: hypothetical protein K5930_02535, partial [Treponemataceae bacterium]|nr:hypothetical protein [Treponemataceae bacterium]